MEEEIYTIQQSKLESAQHTNDQQWLEETFDEAARKIKSGGKVHILQEFSDRSTELVAIIDSVDMLEYYKEKYTAE